MKKHKNLYLHALEVFNDLGLVEGLNASEHPVQCNTLNLFLSSDTYFVIYNVLDHLF